MPPEPKLPLLEKWRMIKQNNIHSNTAHYLLLLLLLHIIALHIIMTDGRME